MTSYITQLEIVASRSHNVRNEPATQGQISLMSDLMDDTFYDMDDLGLSITDYRCYLSKYRASELIDMLRDAQARQNKTDIDSDDYYTANDPRMVEPVEF